MTRLEPLAPEESPRYRTCLNLAINSLEMISVMRLAGDQKDIDRAIDLLKRMHSEGYSISFKQYLEIRDAASSGAFVFPIVEQVLTEVTA